MRKTTAADRTLGLFSQKTRLEEAEALLVDESPEARPEGPRDLVAEHEATVPRWLGLDAFVDGDDIRPCIHPRGHAVLQVVGPKGSSVRELGLSRRQLQKLKALCREA